MPRGKRSRIKIPEMTSDSPKQIKASQARVGRLKSRGGYVANPKDRGEMLYGKGGEPKRGTASKGIAPKISSAKKKRTISSGKTLGGTAKRARATSGLRLGKPRTAPKKKK